MTYDPKYKPMKDDFQNEEDLEFLPNETLMNQYENVDDEDQVVNEQVANEGNDNQDQVQDANMIPMMMQP